MGFIPPVRLQLLLAIALRNETRKSYPGQSHVPTRDWSVDFFCKLGTILSTANASPHIVMPVSGLH